MRKLLLCIFSITLSLILVSCNMDNDVKPMNQLNTKWVSKNPDVFFTVTKDKGYNVCVGKLKTSQKNYSIMFDFDEGREVNIIDYDIFEKNNYLSTMEDLIARGDCKFSKDKCIVTIKQSYIDSIKVGDRITFVKQES